MATHLRIRAWVGWWRSGRSSYGGTSRTLCGKGSHTNTQTAPDLLPTETHTFVFNMHLCIDLYGRIGIGGISTYTANTLKYFRSTFSGAN